MLLDFFSAGLCPTGPGQEEKGEEERGRSKKEAGLEMAEKDFQSLESLGIFQCRICQ